MRREVLQFSYCVGGLCFYGGKKTRVRLRLFSVESFGRQMIRNFSFRQRLHLLLELLYGECEDRMRHEI